MNVEEDEDVDGLFAKRTLKIVIISIVPLMMMIEIIRMTSPSKEPLCSS